MSNLCALSAFPPLGDVLGTVAFFQPPADTRYLVLASEKDEDATRRQSGVNFGCLTDSIAHIVRRRASVKMNRYWVLAGWDLDDWGRSSKKCGIFYEVADPKRSRHDDQTQWL